MLWKSQHQPLILSEAILLLREKGCQYSEDYILMYG